MERILHITGGMQRAGAETLLMNLYRNLDRTKFQFDFLYFTDKTCDYDQEIKRLGGNIYRVTNKSNNKLFRIIYRYVDYYRLLKALPEHQIIHSHINLNGAFFILIAYLLKKRLRISHSHISMGKRAFIPNMYRYLCRNVIKYTANVYLACGEAAGAYLYPKISKKDVVVFPNSIDISAFQSFFSHGHFLRNELKLDKNIKIIVQIGRFTPQKNFEFTIDFIEYLVKKDSLLHFVFLGTGPMETELKQAVNNKNIGSYVTFYGISEEIPKILHSADLFFMPSRLEGFPVVLVEAQACGTPCLISTNISSEVDMGVNLISFASLSDNLEIWKKKFYKSFSRKSNDFDTITRVMKSKNFDAVDSVLKLQDIYKK